MKEKYHTADRIKSFKCTQTIFLCCSPVPLLLLKVKEISKCKGENYRLLKYIVWKSVHFSNISNALHNSWWSKWRGCNIIEDNTIRKSVWIFHSISFSFFSSETKEKIIKKYRELEIQSLERTGSRITNSSVRSPLDPVLIFDVIW